MRSPACNPETAHTGFSATTIVDGWNLIAELDALSALPDLPVKTVFVWGLDLSGSLQGAGGIGGLLSSTDHTASPLPLTAYPCYDGNGNVVALVDSGSGAVSATYEFDPFGNLLAATGPGAATNPFRFSTKYLDAETGLYYYGYRYYSPGLGRWISRDPIGEEGDVACSIQAAFRDFVERMFTVFIVFFFPSSLLRLARRL